MLDVQQAAHAATNHLVSLYPQQVLNDVRLEEVELSDDENYWFITLSYLPATPISLLHLQPRREYKVFKIDSQTGRVRSMKIRNLD